MSKDVFLWLMTNMFLFIAFMGIFAHVGATIAVKLAEMLGFGDYRAISFTEKLDQLHAELETGKEVNVREFLNET